MSGKPKEKGIRIAATSDLHGFLEGLEEEVLKAKPDILVIAGDIHPCLMNVSADQWFRTRFFPFVKRLSCEVVAIPGNHDFWFNEVLSGNDGGWRDKVNYPSNFHLLCDTEETICGLKFYGTPWTPWINGKWCWEASDKTLEYVYSKIPQNLDVLVTHSPPHIEHKTIDISTQRPKQFWRHFGSKALWRQVAWKAPRYVFCGHIHSGDHDMNLGKSSLNGSMVTKIYNVSRVNEMYEVAYPLTVVDLAAKE